jgi:hypothetical protein
MSEGSKILLLHNLQFLIYNSPFIITFGQQNCDTPTHAGAR